MAYHYIGGMRDQQFLLPTSMREKARAGPSGLVGDRGRGTHRHLVAACVASQRRAGPAGLRPAT